jgi:hypothetical protein
LGGPEGRSQKNVFHLLSEEDFSHSYIVVLYMHMHHRSATILLAPLEAPLLGSRSVMRR